MKKEIVDELAHISHFSDAFISPAASKLWTDYRYDTDVQAIGPEGFVPSILTKIPLNCLKLAIRRAFDERLPKEFTFDGGEEVGYLMDRMYDHCGNVFVIITEEEPREECF